MQRLEAAYGRLLELLALAACALILGMTLMICADVLLRNVRIVPGLAGLEWANEISEGMLYLVTLLTAPWLMRKGPHIRVDIILRAVPSSGAILFPPGAIFSTATTMETAAIHARFMTPPTNSRTISAQQHPMHSRPWRRPMRNAPATPGFHSPRRNPSGVLQVAKQTRFSGVNW